MPLSLAIFLAKGEARMRCPSREPTGSSLESAVPLLGLSPSMDFVDGSTGAPSPEDSAESTASTLVPSGPMMAKRESTEIGRASCRERVESPDVAVDLKTEQDSTRAERSW